VSTAGRLAAAGFGLALGRSALRTVSRVGPEGALRRTNFRGRPVSLAGGPALIVAASLSAATGALAERRGRLAVAALLAGLGAGAVGLYDDLVGVRPDQRAKGLRGHLRALAEGRVTSGAVKVAGITAAGLAAAAVLPGVRGGRVSRALDVGLGAGVIAGTANLLNLLDLRPGRALKAGLMLAAPLAAAPGGAAVAGPAGAAAAVLADDLGERVMIGDAGANALGALLGVTLAAGRGPVGRAALLAGIGAVTLASERVSFTEVIDATPGLRYLDRLGRRT
jgi:UDP-N-acetylmuramyl pentapeptide phosphotransferase/UDP-N-acetylglucosamine-1-phosphate transferase